MGRLRRTDPSAVPLPGPDTSQEPPEPIPGPDISQEPPEPNLGPRLTNVRRVVAVAGGAATGILVAVLPVLGDPVSAGATTLIALYAITGN
ncbi:hypothetical protein [Actinomadura sp. 9N215]|uniref:hypothetical protein n=1 Tax=Actinomadura sp. 9N215 TaxID=3375150 RepID=UPI0037A35394